MAQQLETIRNVSHMKRAVCSLRNTFRGDAWSYKNLNQNTAMSRGSLSSHPAFGCEGSLSAKQALELAKVYLENARNADDSNIAMVLCHDTKVSLSQAKKVIKRGKESSLD
ncbi:hypothetical protein B0O80DRAFT_431220 [Mortierella sp. GBAus27b]|nr:hypothetical protein B0O80DRAFT_431220 [Mortierella sp. GBAus27b]